MSRYRGIQTDIWDNEWFVEQDKDIQFYWLFLLTNQWTEHSGIYRMRQGIDALYCHGDRTVTARWRNTLTNAGKAYFEDNWVYIPTYVEKQATPNVPMWKSMLDQIKNAPSKYVQDWIDRYESEIPDACSDRVSTVKARCGHGEGTVPLRSDNENVNENVNENEKGNGFSPLSRMERLEAVAESPHYQAELTETDRDDIAEIIEHYQDVTGRNDDPGSNKFIGRVCERLANNGKVEIKSVIDKAHRLGEQDDYFAGITLCSLLSPDKFNEILAKPDPNKPRKKTHMTKPLGKMPSKEECCTDF